MRRRVGSLRIIVANDLIALRDIVERELTNLDAAVATCPNLAPATAADWAARRALTVHWVDTVNAELSSVFPSFRKGELYAQGLGLEAVLRTEWWPRLTAAGCSFVFPQPGPPPEPGLSSDTLMTAPWFTSLEGVAKALCFVLILREVREWTR